MRPAATVAEALAAADELGYPVALKATAPHLRHHRELGGVRLDVDDAEEMRGAFEAMAGRLGEQAGGYVVQAMAPTGVATRLATVEDPLFGPVVSFGLGGVATDLLGDRSYGVPAADRRRPRRSGPRRPGRAAAARARRAAPRWTCPRSRTCWPGWPGWPTTCPRWPRSSSTRWSPRPCRAAVLAATGRLARPAARAERGARALGA